MAIISLKEVPVTYLNQTGNGVEVTESHESKGRTFSQKFKLWFNDPSGLAVGDIISVSGFLSAKLGKPWTDRDGNVRQAIELSVNSPRLEGDTSSSHVPVQEQEPENVWPDTEATPF